MLPISMGNSDFREIREEGYYYIDKSLMIRELLQDLAKVTLLLRPRRFGKTLNLKMCEAFFSDRDPKVKLFEGLAIMDDAKSMEHFGIYPTVSLTFKDLHADSWASCQIKLKWAVSELFQKFEDQISPTLTQKRVIAELINSDAPIEHVEKSLFLLTQLLHKQSGKKVMVLIDEYDAPIQDGYFFGYYDKIVGFMRGFLGAVLKDNVHLRKGVLTGVLRIAQESLFSGLNNIQVYTVHDQSYSDCFGFTEQEVKKVLSDCQIQAQETEIRAWYNGYRIGHQTLYNPWSILSVAAHADSNPRGYWINTAQDKLIENLITRERCLTLADLSSLLMGESLVREIRPSVALNRIDGQSIWSLLLFSGYLTFTEQVSETHFALKLPNLEVRYFFEGIVRRWIQGSASDSDPLQEILTQGNLEVFKAFVQDRVLRLVGIHDTSGRSVPENFYHGLILGLVAYRLDDLYVITSNRESGLGRYDLQLSPRLSGHPGYIFEFKSLKKDKDLKQGAEQALAQIKEKAYPVQLLNQGVNPIWLVGVAFHGKSLEMHWIKAEQAHPAMDSRVEKNDDPLVFIGYARKDTNWLGRLQPFLKASLRGCAFTIWDEQGINTLSNGIKEIGEAIASAQVAILLISVDFLASDFIEQHEVRPLLARAERGELAVFLIPVRHADWEGRDFTRFQAAWSPLRPLAGLDQHEQDVALTQIAVKVKAHLRALTR